MATRIANPLALAVLALLFERPMHPYEMAATLKERHKEESIKLRYGSLYTVIELLLARGYIRAIATSREGKRPERASRLGRPRTSWFWCAWRRVRCFVKHGQCMVSLSREPICATCLLNMKLQVDADGQERADRPSMARRTKDVLSGESRRGFVQRAPVYGVPTARHVRWPSAEADRRIIGNQAHRYCPPVDFRGGPLCHAGLQPLGLAWRQL